MKAMILAAGFGKRMKEVTKKLPKSLISIGDKTLLERTIENLVNFGIKEIVINVSWLSELIMSQIGDGTKYGAKIHWSEEVHPLETGGGIYKALDILGNKPFITINGDIWIEPEAIKLLLDNYKVHMPGLLLLATNPDHNSEGDFSIESGLLAYETPRHTFSGLSILSKQLFELHDPSIKKFPLIDIFNLWIEKKDLFGIYYQGPWFDVGTKERLLECESYVRYFEDF